MRWRGATCLVVHALAAIGGAAGAADRLSHAGKVVDASTGKPLPTVVVTAYATSTRAETKPCPRYEGFLDDDESAADGAFTLRIPPTNSSYVVTYCSTAYETFTKEANDNLQDGATVQPEPVRLWRVDGSAAAMSAAITRVRSDAQKAIASLRKANALAFATAVESLEEPEQALVRRWMTTTAQSSDAPDDSPSPAQDLVQLTGAVHTTLSYFQKASPRHFRTEIERFEELNEYLRKREVPSRESLLLRAIPLTLAPKLVLPKFQDGDERSPFVVRIFFHGVIAFIPNSDGDELLVLLVKPRSSDLAQPTPLLLARAGRCEGDCGSPAAVATIVFPTRSKVVATAALASALVAGGAWRLQRSDVSLRGPEGPLGYVVNVRTSNSAGQLSAVPTTPTEREDFSWVPDLRKIDPSVHQLDATLSAQQPGAVVAARLRLRSGKVFTYAMVSSGGAVRPMRFASANPDGFAASYEQAVAAWVAVELSVPGDALEIVDQSLDTDARRIMKLHPKDGIVEIAVVNLLPRSRPLESRAARQCFHVYYDLFASPPRMADRLETFDDLRRGAAQGNWSVLHPRESSRSGLLDAIAEGDDSLCPMVTVY